MHFRDIKQKKLKTGGVAMVTKFPSAQTVSIVGSIRGGSQSVRSLLKSSSGTGAEFAKIHAEMLLEGTLHKTKKEIQALLDELGASLAFTPTHDRLVFSARVRVKHMGKLLSLIVEILSEPSFPKAELSILKKREQAELTLEAQDTHEQALIGLARLLFPKEHPNFSESTKESGSALREITSETLEAYHQKLIDRRSLILSCSGDVKSSVFFALAQRAFSRLPANTVTFKPTGIARPSIAKKVRVHIKDKAGIDYMVGIAPRMTKEYRDYPALLLGIQVLGNPGFTGRLMKTVREKEGLTYVAYSYISGMRKKLDGHISIWTSFAPQAFERGRAAVLREIRALAEAGATDEEVQKHRELFEARFRVRLSNSGTIAQAMHDCIADGYPLSYLEAFPKRMLKLTTKEVNAALKKYLDPKKLAESAAGPIEKKSLKR